MKKYLTYIKENKSQITVQDVAWLYFLHYSYKRKMLIRDWKNDQRMGTNFLESLNKFDCVKIDGDYIYSDKDCEKIIDKYFGSKTFENSVLMTDNLKEYDNNDPFYVYKISKIPYGLYLKKNPNIEKNFDRITHRLWAHFNSQSSNDHIIKTLSKSRDLKKWNFKELYNMFGYVPEKITIYRGIKSEYDPKISNKYSCWTTSKKTRRKIC